MTRDRVRPGAPLVLEWEGGSLRLPLGVTGRIEKVDELIPVPGAPRGVIGLGEARGRAVTLLCPALFLPSWPLPAARSRQCFSCDSSSAQDLVERSSRRSSRSQVSVLTFASPHEHLGLLVTRGTTLRRADKEDEDLTLIDEACLDRTVGLLIRPPEAVI